MTRLTEALARAGETDKEAAERLVDPAEVAAAIPGSWRFETAEANEPDPQSAAATQSPADRLEVSDADRQKAADDVADKARAVADLFDETFATLPSVDTLVVGPNPNKTLVEQYRHLAAALHHAQLKSGARTVMVASAVQSEGKTTTATNLALTLSESHQRQVLLIDADLRRPSVHTMLQLSNHAGLSDTLRDIAPDARVPLHRISPTLSVITAGRPTQDPMSALVSDMMKRFIREASEQYDWIVIDTPPVALLSDANLLAAMIDLAILVVGASSTPYPLVRRAVDALGASKIVGVVLNRAERSELSSGYGYYGYGYSYAYGESTPPKKRWALPFGWRR